MSQPQGDIEWVREYLHGLVPEGVPLVMDERDPFCPDECRWFRAAVENSIIEQRGCAAGLCNLKKRKHPRKYEFRDEFVVPGQQADRICHLLSASEDHATLNREYVPHIAAYVRAVVEFGYPIGQSSFSKYQKFGRDLVEKRTGEGYETDAEFYDSDGRIHLHVEVKRSPAEVSKLVRAIESGETPKELEYVLDLAPRFLWIVGPGSIDPEAHVYEVAVEGLNARFLSVDSLPRPSGTASGA